MKRAAIWGAVNLLRTAEMLENVAAETALHLGWRIDESGPAWRGDFSDKHRIS